MLINGFSKLWFNSVLLAFIFLIFTLISTLFNSESEEALMSALRIVFSIIVWPVFFRRFKLIMLIKVVFTLGFVNSLLACLQFYDSVVNPFLPEYLLYGNLWGFESIEPFRNGGFMNGLQASSILALLSIAIGLRFKFKFSLIWFAVNYFTIFTGSRTLLILSSVLVFYYIYLNWIKSLLIIYILLTTLPNIEGFNSYFNDRIITAFKVFLSLDPSQDYSSEDTITHYRTPSSLKEWLVGNGKPRYSSMGGKDPFFSRWLLQVGLFASLSLLAMLGLIFYYLFRIYPLASVILLLIWAITSIKGELFTAFGVFDLFVIGVFVIAPEYRLKRLQF